MPERLVGSRSHKQKGRYPWQPWKREPPPRSGRQPAPSHWLSQWKWLTWPILTYKLDTMREGWEGVRIRKDSQKYRANDPQRSAGRKACVMQDDTTALQISQGPPHRSRGTADCIGSSLTLPKSCLVTFKPTYNCLFKVLLFGMNFFYLIVQSSVAKNKNKQRGGFADGPRPWNSMWCIHMISATPEH